MPLDPYSGTLGKKAAAHLLRRATFGPRKSDIDTFAGYTPTQALAALFQATPEPAEPVLSGTNTTWMTSPPSQNEDDGDQQNYFKAWWLGQMLNTNVASGDRLAFSTREKIAFFYHTLFTTIQETVGSSRALYFQNVLFRRFALDENAAAEINMKTLAKKMCIDNAMLVLLDGRLNVKGNPNENFAREIIELYTVGKGLSGQVPAGTGPGDYVYFTETDVQQLARVLSGYDFDDQFATLDDDTNLPRAKVKFGNGTIANQHENSTKTFSSNWAAALGVPTVEVIPDPALLIGGEPTEDSMLDELDQVIDHIFNMRETALHYCRRIYRFYVYHDITVAIDNDIIAEMADLLVSSNFKIETVIKKLLASQHFYDSATATVNDDNFGAIIKSPLDLVCGTLNFFEYQMPDFVNQSASFYMKAETLLSMMSDQGMNFLNPYDVAGYEAYHQYPLFNRHWINTNALTQRYNFIYLTMNVMNTVPESVSIDLLDYMKTYFAANATDADVLVRDVVSYILPLTTESTEITTARLDWFKSRLLLVATGNADPEAYWVLLWNNAYNNAQSEEDARGALQDMINAMMQSPEYQLL